MLKLVGSIAPTIHKVQIWLNLPSIKLMLYNLYDLCDRFIVMIKEKTDKAPNTNLVYGRLWINVSMFPC